MVDGIYNTGISPTAGTNTSDTASANDAAMATSATEARSISPIYAYAVVAIFLAAYTLAYIDRMVLSLLVDRVKGDLQLTEVEVSVLMGFAFASFYIVMGLPFGRLVDASNRVRLIVFGVLLWSIATVACGFASNFWEFFAARAMVGVGEAALSPAVYSLLPDYFRRDRVGFALALFSCGTTIGGGAGMMVAGYLVEQYSTGSIHLFHLTQLQPWQLTFISVALPGFVVAPLTWLIAREPVRKGGSTQSATTAEVFAFIRRNRKAVGPLTLGLATHGVCIYAFGVWGPAYFMRVHHMTAAQVGAIIGTLFLVMGTVGTLTSGFVHDKLLGRGMLDASSRLSFWVALSAIPAILPAYLVKDRATALVFYAIGILFAKAILPLQPAMIRALFPGRMRGRVSAIYIGIVTIVGLGIGPTAIAFMTEHLFGGVDKTGLSLAISSVTAALIGAALIRTSMPHATALAQEIAAEEDRHEITV